MKITKQQLKQIIKEELKKVLNEVDYEGLWGANIDTIIQDPNIPPEHKQKLITLWNSDPKGRAQALELMDPLGYGVNPRLSAPEMTQTTDLYGISEWLDALNEFKWTDRDDPLRFQGLMKQAVKKGWMKKVDDVYEYGFDNTPWIVVEKEENNFFAQLSPHFYEKFLDYLKQGNYPPHGWYQQMNSYKIKHPHLNFKEDVHIQILNKETRLVAFYLKF